MYEILLFGVTLFPRGSTGKVSVTVQGIVRMHGHVSMYLYIIIHILLYLTIFICTSFCTF